MRRAIASRLVLLIAVAAFPGCTGSDATAGISLDTLPGGTVIVRNTGDGAWDSDDAWTAGQIVSVGGADADTNSEFGRVAAIEFDDAGRIYVADAQARSIVVFDSTGRFVRRLGRSGEGPGEFSLVNGIIWGPDGHLWAVDPRMRAPGREPGGEAEPDRSRGRRHRQLPPSRGTGRRSDDLSHRV